MEKGWEPTEIESFDQSAEQVLRRLKWIAVAIFIAAVVISAASDVVYFATGAIKGGTFASDLVFIVVLISALVLTAYLLVRRAWLRAFHSERKVMLTQQRLVESEERYHELFTSSVDGIMFKDVGGRIVEHNEAFAVMLGYDPDELGGRFERDLTPREWWQVDADVNEFQVEKTGRSDEYFKEFARKDGSMVPVSVRAWAVTPTEGGGRSGTWAIVRDLSERKKYETFIHETLVRLEDAYDRCQEVDRLKTEFVAMVTHELRAPLGTIESSLGALRAVCPDDREAQELVNIVERGTGRLSHLIDDLLDITRIESGQLKLKVASDDAFDLATRVVNAFEPRFAAAGVALRLEGEGGPCMGRYDASRVEQVLTNLVDNALKFSKGGEVVVRVVCTPNRVVLSVSDSGPGVPLEQHDAIFQKFFSTGSAGENEGGTGLGLAISKGIVEAHGGSIRVESHLGAGSTFTFDLPRDTGAVTPV